MDVSPLQSGNYVLASYEINKFFYGAEAIPNYSILKTGNIASGKKSKFNLQKLFDSDISFSYALLDVIPTNIDANSILSFEVSDNVNQTHKLEINIELQAQQFNTIWLIGLPPVAIPRDYTLIINPNFVVNECLIWVKPANVGNIIKGKEI